MAKLTLALQVGAKTALTLNPTYSVPALALSDWLVQCQYQQLPGVFSNDLLWQSGNTIESLSILAAANSSSHVYDSLLNNTYLRTSPVVDNCFDDHQWWILAWISAYELNGNPLFLQRAAQGFDYIVNLGWETSTCGGGVQWCPVNPGQAPYKNAVTNELFLTAAARLNVHSSALSAPAGYYLSWAQRAWAWFETSGMINSAGLINDGLDSKSCTNNNGTTWTYNQGVLLDGLALLAEATGNSTLVAVAMRVANATMMGLSQAGILQEPCGKSCDGDQHIFKGVFVRHLGKMLLSSLVPAQFKSTAIAWLQANADSILATDSCSTGGYGLLWQGPCAQGIPNDTATSSAALDALTAAAYLTSNSPSSSFGPLGLGNCQDDAGQGMPNCYSHGLMSQAQCQAVSAADANSPAYDFMTNCDGTTFCRVRTSSGASSCPPGWSWTGGTATSVTSTNGAHLTVCMHKAA